MKKQFKIYETTPRVSKWAGPLVLICGGIICLAQYIPYLAFYTLDEVDQPVIRNDGHYADLIYMLIGRISS